jgi:hypothetical protein
MDVIRCLYFDDNPQELDRYAKWIRRAWDKLRIGVPIEVETAISTEEVEKKLREADGAIDLFVTDLLVGKKNEPLGLPTLKNAKEDYPLLAIVVLSVADTAIERDALKVANAFVPKSFYARGDPENALGRALLGALRDCGKEPISSELEILKFEADDLPLSSVVETIGRANLISLTTQAIEHTCTAIRPIFVRSGLSGASVIRVDCDYMLIDGEVKRSESRSLLLKISYTPHNLIAELKKDISDFPEELFIRFTGKEPIRSGPWYAIATRFKLEGQTLIDWLVGKFSGGHVETALASFLLDPERGLASVYKKVGRVDDKRPNSELWDLLSLGRRARIRLAIDELKRLSKKYGGETFDEKLLDDFLTARRIVDVDEESVRRGVTYCLSHGDLHSRNVVVGKSRTASLIDPANVGVLHWAADIARLVVDLIVSAWDYGDKSHEWNSMTEWVELSKSVVRGEIDNYAGLAGHPNERVHTAVKWLRENLFEIHGVDDPERKPEWEFRLALAVEFMRAAYRHQDLTSPKRALGLISACEALRETAAAYRRFVKT